MLSRVLAVAMAVAVAWCAGNGEADVLAGRSRFAVETTVLVAEAQRAVAAADLGYRLRAELTVHADPDPHDRSALLAFRLHEMQLLVREATGVGAGAGDYESRASVWDGRDDTVYAERRDDGRVLRLLHDPAAPTHLLDYARALLSLFQFRMEGGGDGREGGERNETDVSGECVVLYETVAPDTFRKVKRRCEHDEGVGVEARRVTRYRVGGRGAEAHLAALVADEVVTARIADLAVKARSLHTLTLLDHSRPAPAPGSPPPHYVEASLAMLPLEPPDPDDALTAEEAVREFGAALEGGEAGGGGEAAGVAALVRLLPVLQAASAEELTALVRADRPAERVRALCGALGLAGTGAAATAVRRADPPEPLVREYLAGLGLALAPHPAAVAAALALAEETRSATLASAALLAAGAAASRVAADPALEARVRDRITRSLARCKDEACRRGRVAALGNTRSAAAADTLLAHAERAARGAGLGALVALAALPRLQPPHLARLAALAGNASRSLEERAAALEGVAGREAGAPSDALPLRTADAWRALHAERSAAAGELRRLLEQRVAALAARGCRPARRLLAALPPQLRGWDAPPGASTVLVRNAGWTSPASGWRAELDSRQVTERGLLRRGRVALSAAREAGAGNAPGDRRDLLAVELWTRGLAALAGTGAGADADDAGDAGDETVAAGLGLAVAGVSLPDLDLFEGQGELVGHIWAGTGSADTRVLRAAWAEGAGRGALPLAGGVTLGVRAGAALAAALDARASVSLWQRAARGALVLRAAAAARLSLRLASPSGAGALRLEARASTAPRLRIHADLDFYDGVALCVRASTAAHEEVRETVAEAGARRRGGAARLVRAPRTLSLGRENDVACRTLRSADDDDSAPD